VKDMGRKQQQAVFANMGDSGYLRRLESAEQYKRRTEYLKRKHDLAEDVEDKLFDVWNNKNLTHRQKMIKASALKKDAKKKLESYQKAEFAPTITGKIRATQEKRFAEKYGISGVRKTNRASLEELEGGAKYEYKYGKHKVIGMESARVLAAKNLKSDSDYYKKKYKALSDDNDKDGVANFLDCEPNNPKKQHDDLARYAAGKEHIPTTRQHLYKDAYKTKEEAEDIADYLTKDEHKRDVFVFKDKDGDWNISYNE